MCVLSGNTVGAALGMRLSVLLCCVVLGNAIGVSHRRLLTGEGLIIMVGTATGKQCSVVLCCVGEIQLV